MKYGILFIVLSLFSMSTYSTTLPEKKCVLDIPGINNTGVDCSAGMRDLISAIRSDQFKNVYFPAGTYKFSIDISGPALGSIWYCQSGTNFVPMDNLSIIRSDNTDYGQGGTGLEIFGASLSTNDEANYCIWLKNTSGITLRNCALQEARVAAFYGDFAQYCKFYDCNFSACVFSDTSAGCIFTGPSSDLRSNEIEFFRCQIMSNSNGLLICGSEKARINDCTFQDNNQGYRGFYTLKFSNDAQGNGSRGCHVSGCWFEKNAKRDIQIDVAEGLVIDKCFITNGDTPKEISIEATYCYNLQIIGNHFMCSGSAKFSHEDNFTQASLTYTGNNLIPDLSNLSAKPASINLILPNDKLTLQENIPSQPGLFSGAAFQNNTPGNPLLKTDFAGFKQNILRNDKTLLFEIVPEILAERTQAYDWANLEITLSGVHDKEDSNIFGYSQRIDNYYCVLNNYQSNLQCAVNFTSGTSFGQNINYTEIGHITLTAEKVSNENKIRVYVQYSCVGCSNPEITSRITIGYKVSSMGSGRLNFIRK